MQIVSMFDSRKFYKERQNLGLFTLSQIAILQMANTLSHTGLCYWSRLIVSKILKYASGFQLK